MIIAHIAGVPVEETLLSFAPVGAAAVGATVFSARSLMGSLRARLARVRRRTPDA